LNSDAILTALDLPAGSRVDQRVPKKLLLEHGAPTAADKRHINEGIEELLWVAALKPTTIGVPEYRDDAREYVEIAVLRLTVRASGTATRLVELVHRAIPYPVLLLTEYGAQSGTSVAHKRWSLGEAGKTVLDGEITNIDWDAVRDADYGPAFRDALALGRQPRATLYALYQGWLDTLVALHAARITGTFAVATNTEQASARRDALRECARLDTEIIRLRASAAREKQMRRQVELNLELKRIEAQLATARKRI
jgi:Domain of unknown function (DUF4391)